MASVDSDAILFATAKENCLPAAQTITGKIALVCFWDWLLREVIFMTE